MNKEKTVLITGALGQDGRILSEILLKKKIQGNRLSRQK